MEGGGKGERGEKEHHEKVNSRVESSKLFTFWQLNSIRCIFGKKVGPQTQFPSLTIAEEAAKVSSGPCSRKTIRQAIKTMVWASA